MLEEMQRLFLFRLDAARHVFDPSMVPPGQDSPGSSDAKAMIDQFLEAHAQGSSRRELRAVVRSAHTLMQKVTHSGSISRADAIACGSATVLVVRTLQQLETDSARKQQVVRPRSVPAVKPRTTGSVKPRTSDESVEPAERDITTEWSAGDRVTHQRFGQGIVVSSRVVGEDEEVTVAFVGQGVKRLIARFAKLTRN